jgi:hypothetical protein
MTPRRLSDRYARFCDLLTLAEECFAARDFQGAAGLAHVAARYAFPSIGLFASPRLERLLLEIGKQIPSDENDTPSKSSGKRRDVLHVLTHARPLGGDSRFVWRWMQQDGSSCHSVAITTQAAVSQLYDMPKDLVDAAVKSGGRVHVLNAPSSAPLEQARELRRLCQGRDVVILHLFPYDIVPLLALAAGCGSVRTAFVNHADHTFWVGSSVAHTIIHLRKQSNQFLRTRRAIEPARSSILPIPLVHAPSRASRAEAKRSLGYAPEVVLLLTIASPFKYNSPGQTSFLNLVTPVLVQNPQAVLIAVGPEPKGAWRSAKIQTNGRVVALGTRWDNEVLCAAADIYLDSVPFSSITSALEAGCYGIPVVGLSPANPELELLGAGAPGLEDAMELTRDPESYRNRLNQLIKDAELRRRSGQHIQESITALHIGSGWLRALDRVYSTLAGSAHRSCLIEAEDRFQSDALNEALLRLYSSVLFSARQLIRAFIGPLPYRSRLSITWRLCRVGLGLSWLNLLPPPADTLVHGAGRQSKRLGQRLLRPCLATADALRKAASHWARTFATNYVSPRFGLKLSSPQLIEDRTPTGVGRST